MSIEKIGRSTALVEVYRIFTRYFMKVLLSSALFLILNE